MEDLASFPSAARWTVRPPAPPAAVEALSRALQVPPALAAVLWARGLRDSAADHLDPRLELSPNPALPLAAERVVEALTGRRRILIHGDYDADGISGAALLLLGLRELGGQVDAFIPDRLTDGYGIAMAKVEQHAARAELLITVDCGVSNLEEIRRLTAAGVEVIVTDHHSPGDELPDCLVVHPGLSPMAAGGLPQLTGAGVAFHLLWAVRERLGLEPPLDYADLAALGTIADVAPLLGENRALIREGLARMRESRWPGLRAVVTSARLRRDPSARDVAFVLAPRLNAAGRLGEADKGLELLTTASERQARELAAYLELRNQDRRKVQDEMFEHALTLVDDGAPALVLTDPGWHAGVMGIVAAKLLERFYKPVFIATGGKGSVRSTPGISAVGGLRAAAPHLLRYGGHAQAAGFGIDMERFTAFSAAVNAFVAEHAAPERTVVIDAVLSRSEVVADLQRAIRDLEPFGEGHAEPLFALSDRLELARPVGRDGATLQLRVAGVKGVAWRRGEHATALPLGATVDVACNLRENDYNGQTTLEFEAQALRAAAPLGLSTDGSPPPASAEGEAPFSATRAPRAGAASSPLLSGGDTLAAIGALVAAAVSAGRPAAFDLSESDLIALEEEAVAYPTVGELRRSYVAFRRGNPPWFEPPKDERVRAALTELGLLDEFGRAVVTGGEKVSPYESATLMSGLLRRYRLRSFVHAYRHFDDEAFSASVLNLFGGEPAEAAEQRRLAEAVR